jgi:hypothetical protein
MLTRHLLARREASSNSRQLLHLNCAPEKPL